jgi:hypothetical protein
MQRMFAKKRQFLPDFDRNIVKICRKDADNSWHEKCLVCNQQ